MEKLKEILLRFFKLDSIVGHLTGYVETRIALIKMEVREEVANALSRGLIILIMFLIAFLFLIFLSIAVAEYLNFFLEGEHMGFALVAGFYGLVLLLMIIFRKALLKAFEKQFVGLVKNKDN